MLLTFAILFVIWVVATGLTVWLTNDMDWDLSDEVEHDQFWMLVGTIPVRLHSPFCEADHG